MNLEDLGYGDWVRAQLGNIPKAEAQIARVLTVDRDRYLIGSARGSIPAELTGRLMYVLRHPRTCRVWETGCW